MIFRKADFIRLSAFLNIIVDFEKIGFEFDSRSSIQKQSPTEASENATHAII